MNRKKSKLLSVLLAAVLVFQSAGMTVMAETDPTVSTGAELVTELAAEESAVGEATENTSEDTYSDAQETAAEETIAFDAETASEESIAASEEPSQTSEESAASESSAEDISAGEPVSPSEDVSTGEPVSPSEDVSAGEPVNPSEDVSAGEPAEDVSAGEPVDTPETESLFPGLSGSYVLSDEQLDAKKVLSEHVGDFSDYVEEDNTDIYVKGEVVYLAESEEEAQAVAEAFGAELRRYENGVAVILLPENRTVAQACIAAADSTTLLPAVWPNYYKQLYYSDPALSDTNTDYQWQHEFVGDSYVWDIGFKGQGIKVGILDTGILKSHTEFSGRIANSAGSDTNGHGTHVAGIVAANLDNNAGGAGIAPEASLYVYAIGNSDGSITSEIELIALKQAINDNLHLVNMSFGSPVFDANENTCIQEAYKAGIALFAAAGNEATNGLSYPASYKNVCSIASLQQDGKKSFFTNYNDAVDLAFPGSEIYSTSMKSKGYEYMSGTSMACPVAAGTAAVILSGADSIPELKGKTGSKRVDALYKVMKKNAIKSPSKGTGSGTTYLPKVFGLKSSNASGVPSVPRFSLPSKNAFNTPTADLLLIGDASPGVEIYYNTKGKTPSYKNGSVNNGTLYNGTPITIGGAKTVTVKALAVNRLTGKASKVVTQKYKFTPPPTAVEVRATGSVDSLAPGSKVALKAYVTPSYAVSTKVKWSISPADSNVTINKSGKVTVSKTATAGTTFTVTATAVDKKGVEYKIGTTPVTGSLSLKVSSAANIKTITLPKKTASIPIKGTEDLATGMTITNTDGSNGTADKIVWSSSNTKVATVDEKGVVTAIAPGKTDIKATANDGSNKSAVCKVTVYRPATKVIITGTGTIAAGKTVTLKAKLLPDNVSNKALDWSVEGNGVTIKNGKLKASKSASGTCTVTATTKDEPKVSGSCTIKIVNSPITKITVDKTMDLFTSAGASSKQLKVQVEGGDSSAIEFISSAPGIATVDKSGVVHAVSNGKAKITCQATDGSKKKAVCNVTVGAPVSRITIVSTDESAGIVCVGSTIKLGAVIGTSHGTPANKNVIWSVPEEYADIITVNAKGEVKANSLGASATNNTAAVPAQVVATAADGSGATATYDIAVFRKIKKVLLQPTGLIDKKAGVEFTVEIQLDNDVEIPLPPLPYAVEISAPGSHKMSILKAGDNIFYLRADKSTTNKGVLSQLFESDAIPITLKVTLPCCKKSVSFSTYFIQFENGRTGLGKLEPLAHQIKFADGYAGLGNSKSQTYQIKQK